MVRKNFEDPEPKTQKPKPRLVLLLQDLLFGGTQRQALELARRLNPDKYQVELWLLMGGFDLAPVAQSAGLPLVWLSKRPQVGAKAILNLYRRLRHSPPDILMCLTVVPNIWGRLLGRLAGVPLIVGNCRGGAAPRRQHELWLWPLAHHIITNSNIIKASLTNHFGLPEKKVTVIHNGVDMSYFRHNMSDIKHKPPIILSVARLAPDKDHPTLIRAFKLVAMDHPRAQLWLMGDGPEAAGLHQLVAEYRLANKIRFIPGQDDIRPFLQQAAVFVLSSFYEALPNVILEAMAAGLPVVATQVGGVSELVIPGRTGWLVPPRDPSALAAALKHLLTDAATRQAFGLAGQHRAARNFSLRAMVAQHEKLLQELWEEKRNKGK